MVVDTGLEEQALALRAQNGDREALSELVARLRNPLFALAYAHTRHYDDAQDVVASALLRICARIRTLRDPAQARRWMNAVVRNEAYRLLRSRRANVSGTYEESAEEVSGACSEESASLLRLDIEAALRRLPQDHARAMALFYLSGLPVGAIARRLNRPEGTVKFWLYRGRQQLAPHLEGYAPPMNTALPPVTPPAAPWVVSIVSSDFPAALLAQMKAALERAGWDQVNFVGDFAAAAQLLRTDAPANERRAPNAAPSGYCIVIDEKIGARSAFELITLLSATAERKNYALFLLIDNAEQNPDFDLTAMAAYAAGVDMLLSKPFDLADIERFGKRLRAAAPLTKEESRDDAVSD